MKIKKASQLQNLGKSTLPELDMFCTFNLGINKNTSAQT